MGQEPNIILAVAAALFNIALFVISLLYMIVGDYSNSYTRCSSVTVVIPIYLMFFALVGLVTESKMTDRVASVRTKLFSGVNMLSLIYGRAFFYALLGIVAFFFHPELYCDTGGWADRGFFVPFLICGIGYLVIAGIYVVMGLTQKGIESDNKL
eukprot:GEMP01026095.1.p1 GENE.GEMP01026095.1~~GEMP01026095.1.p1  ORF type:complete len:154 (+),score=2.58 GEMP01026095.1:887-1348(+)